MFLAVAKSTATSSSTGNQTSYNFQTGYGLASSAVVTATYGAIVSVDIEIEIDALISSQVYETCNTRAAKYNVSQQYNEDQAKYGGQG